MSKRRATTTRPDSLDLIRAEDERLTDLFVDWDRGAPDPHMTNGDAVERAWKRGTVGKLVLEHGAVRSAAKADVVSCLRRCGHPELAGALGEHATEARRVLDELEQTSRGISSLDLRYADEFGDAVEELRRVWRGELRSETEFSLDKVAAALGSDRSHLRSARFVRKHAPVHPAPRLRWYHRIPPVVRLRVLYDQLRGFPTSESATFSDRELAQTYDTDE